MLRGLKFASQAGIRIPNRFKAWRRIVQDRTLAVAAPKFLNSRSEIFVLGSCFANEIRHVLETSNLVVHPAIDTEIAELMPAAVKLEPAWGRWDERVHYQCYTPFSIQQEIAQATGGWSADDLAIFQSKSEGKTAYWDPYRRSVYAYSEENLLRIRTIMNERIRVGLQRADVIVFTLGFVEAFRVRQFGGFAAEYNTAFRSKLEFYNGDYEASYGAMIDACNRILGKYPDKRIIVTVSPIPLNRTFSDNDVITATMRAKSILRTVADKLEYEFENVYYWPSYEYVMWSGEGFRDNDLRHVRSDTVFEITSAFGDSFFSGDVAQRMKTSFKSRQDRNEIRESERHCKSNSQTANADGGDNRSASGLPTKIYFWRQRRNLKRALDRLLLGQNELAVLHGTRSHDLYEEYGDREMREYERGICRALKAGRLARIPYKDVRACYIAPVVDQIESLGAKLQRSVKVVEIGCGNGTNLMLLRQCFPNGLSLAGIDISPSRIHEGKKYWGAKLANVDMQTASATDLHLYEADSFDLVFSICALEQIPYRLHEVVSEMMRISNGKIVCVEPVYEFGNDVQRLYNVTADQCRTLLAELSRPELHLEQCGLMPVLHNPLNPVGLLRATKKPKKPQL